MTFHLNDPCNKRNDLCIHEDPVPTSIGWAIVQFFFSSLHPAFEKQQGKETQDWFSEAVSYTHLTLPTNTVTCRSRWSPYH